MTRIDENRQLIEGFWDDLYRQDFAALGTRFDPHGEYTDIVTPEDDVARGPAEITARLRLAFDKLSKLFDERRHLVAGEDVVMTEHVEHWEWPSGETMALDVASVHEIRDGQDRQVVGLLGHECSHSSGAAVVVRARPPGLEE